MSLTTKNSLFLSIKKLRPKEKIIFKFRNSNASIFLCLLINLCPAYEKLNLQTGMLYIKYVANFFFFYNVFAYTKIVFVPQYV